jgi:putative transcriptional regulator
VSTSNAFSDSDEELANKIKEVRQELGLTQEQFAVKLGVTFPTVNRWENLKTKPSPLALQKLRKLMVSRQKKKSLINEYSKNSKTPK